MGVRMAVVHLIKLSVGTEDVADLDHWQHDVRYQTADGLPRHVTRMWPKREADLTDGGSIYWVIKGVTLCRQKVVRLDAVTGSDGIGRCAIAETPVSRLAVSRTARRTARSDSHQAG